jgi:gamma-glutamyltranspeptidase/glutathione hydrolase
MMRIPKSKFFLVLLLVIAFIVMPVAPALKATASINKTLEVAADMAASRAATLARREPVRARRAMVASTSRLASEVGSDVMKRGGNAVDAAIAVAFALAVVYPAAGNLGGGGFMLLRLKDGKTTAIDYREMAPGAAHRNVFQDEKGKLIKGEGSSTIGYRAAGVPGTVAGMDLALKRYGTGKLNWTQLIEPARRLALSGFTLTHSLARGMSENRERLELYEDSRRIFLNRGSLYKQGDVLRQAELAATLARLQKGGAREFYEGETARLIVEDMKRHRGLITRKDLRDYVAKERAPLRTTYRGNEIITMPPPSSGGVVLIEMLNMLEGYNLREMGWASARKVHLMTEVMRRAFADRAEYMGDADFVKVPVSGLIDKTYARRLRSTINLERATPSSEVRAGKPQGYESGETTHFTVVDTEGNVVSNTYTLNDSYGAAVVAKGTGILLNNEMDDFAAKPGEKNYYGLVQGENNAVAPRKRPLSSMTPTIVLQANGKVWFAVGSPGGPRIINAVLQIVTNIIDHEMSIQQAIDAPRLHHQWLPDDLIYEPYGLSPDTLRALQSMGHSLKLTTEKETKTGSQLRYMGDAQGILIEEGTGIRLGASDQRNEGVPVGF